MPVLKTSDAAASDAAVELGEPVFKTSRGMGSEAPADIAVAISNFAGGSAESTKLAMNQAARSLLTQLGHGAAPTSYYR